MLFKRAKKMKTGRKFAFSRNFLFNNLDLEERIKKSLVHSVSIYNTSSAEEIKCRLQNTDYTF